MFNKGDVVVAKDGYLDKHETIKDTIGLVLDYNPANDYLELGVLDPEKYFLPPIFCMRGKYYRHVTEEEKKEWNIITANASERYSDSGN